MNQGRDFTQHLHARVAALPEADKRALVSNSPPVTNGNSPKPPQGKFWPELTSAKDFLSVPEDPTRWIWDQTLSVGSVSVIVSKPKVGKSTFCANLSIAIARGYMFLGRQTQKCPVAYLCFDASAQEMRDTFVRLGLREDDDVFIYTGSPVAAQMVPWVMESIKKHSVRFVIIDTLQRFFRFNDINDYSQVDKAMGPLIDAARDENVHILFSHHAKKDSFDDMDSAIGSSAIRGLANTFLHLKKLPESDRRILRSDQRIGKNFSEVALGFDNIGWLEVQGSREDAETELVIPKILEVLADGAEMSEPEIRREIPAAGWVVGRAIRELHRKRNHLNRTGHGKKGDPYRYSVNLNLLSSLSKKQESGHFSRLESENRQKTLAPQGEILVSKFPDENQTRIDENLKTDSSRLESPGWEVV